MTASRSRNLYQHASGVVRGVLCQRCNRILGMVKDNPNVLRSAAEYLERFDAATDSHDQAKVTTLRMLGGL